MKFDKRFVYCIWDDALMAQDVVAASCISSLISKVEHDDDYLMPDTCVCIGCNENMDYPFKVRDEDGQVDSHRFVYYDPNYICKLAYACGKQIQFRNRDGQWEDVKKPVWTERNEYRVKPDEPNKPKYRPYKNIDEFIYEYRTMCHIFGEPLVIWVKDINQDIIFMCDGLDRTDNTVRIEGEWRTMAELLKGYTYKDGTPLGVKE